MQSNRIYVLSAIIGFLLAVSTVVSPVRAAETFTTTWSADAETIYDTGFMHMLMKHPDGGVCLFDMELMENDSPGAGASEKGVHRDDIWGENRARKILYLDDPRAEKAYLVVFNYQQGKYPLKFKVNGNLTQLEKWDTTSYYMNYIWGGFPAEWLKKGKNTIELFCPEAESEKEGWRLYLARADEFEAGGGDPSDVGKTSFKSTNGGETWKESPFGPLGKDRAEYSVRISFDRYVKEGWLASPVIDLWRGESEDFYVRQHTIQKLKLSIRSDVPEDAAVEYYLRGGTNPGPYSDEWEPYEFIGSGPSLEYETGREFNRRYLQLRAVLKTGNPLVSPVVKSVSIEAEFRDSYPVPDHKNIRVVEVSNPPVRYSSAGWEWEKWDRPEFEELRVRENLDELLKGCQTQFEAQVKLLEYASTRWNWTTPMPEYPEWDAMSIVKRINKAGGGGMCIQHNNFLGGICMAYGWQARLVNVDGHEVCEVWNDELAKWIYIDASYNHYLYDDETVEPLNVLDLHRKYLDYYFSGRSIDWKRFKRAKFDPEKEDARVRRGSLSHHKRSTLGGFFNGSFLRYVPRNNWYGKPHPRPLSHGSSVWPWNGYINWYDEQTPRRRQYSWYTDRPRDLYPDLNTVHIHATSGPDSDRLFLNFETYTPNFGHFEVNTNDTGWRKSAEHWTCFFRSGRNTLSVRSVSKVGVKGKPSVVVVNFGDAPFVK